MIATFKSEDTGVLNWSKIKASKYVDHGDLEGQGIGCILLKGLGFGAHHHIAILYQGYSYFN